MRLIGALATLFFLFSFGYASPIADYSDVSSDVAKKSSYNLSENNADLNVYSDFMFITDSEDFKTLPDDLKPEFNLLSFIYLYVALIGFYIAVMVNLNKKTDLIARVLISGFIFIHSFFILHICINITNYQYEYPHTYLMSTSFSFLYGPLLYFYLKRITEQYSFKKIDLLHFIPSILFLIYIVPIYLMSSESKLSLMLNRASENLNGADSQYITLIVALKLISLITYGYFIRKVYLKSKTKNNLSPTSRVWQRNMYYIHVSYIICYAAYGILITNNMSSGILYHSQIIAMALMVMYIGYSANVQPQVFNGSFSINRLFYKYEKSGLTKSLSHELKENLIGLFIKDQVYKESNLCLETLADKLNTTRHNTSQVINEHFEMSFHELINTYRIQEAKELLNNDKRKNLNIIDIAYEVGYNNKVTFNKAFKKDTKLTPSQYQRNVVEA